MQILHVVKKKLQLLGDFVPQTTYQGSTLVGGLSIQFSFFIFIVNLLNKLQIHIFIVIFKIHQLHLHFSHGISTV